MVCVCDKMGSVCDYEKRACTLPPKLNILRATAVGIVVTACTLILSKCRAPTREAEAPRRRCR